MGISVRSMAIRQNQGEICLAPVESPFHQIVFGLFLRDLNSVRVHDRQQHHGAQSRRTRRHRQAAREGRHRHAGRSDHFNEHPPLWRQRRADAVTAFPGARRTVPPHHRQLQGRGRREPDGLPRRNRRPRRRVRLRQVHARPAGATPRGPDRWRDDLRRRRSRRATACPRACDRRAARC